MFCEKNTLWREEDRDEFWNKPHHSQRSLGTRPVEQLAVQDRGAPIDVALTELVYTSRYSCKSPKSSRERADNTGSYHQGTLRNSQESIQGGKAPVQKKNQEHHTQRNSFLFFDSHGIKKIGLCTKLSINGTRLTRYRLPISRQRSNSQDHNIRQYLEPKGANSCIKPTTPFSKEKTWVHSPFKLRY